MKVKVEVEAEVKIEVKVEVELEVPRPIWLKAILAELILMHSSFVANQVCLVLKINEDLLS